MNLLRKLFGKKSTKTVEELFDNRVYTLIKEEDIGRPWYISRIYSKDMSRNRLSKEISKIQHIIINPKNIITSENSVGGENPYYFIAYFCDKKSFKYNMGEDI